MFIYTTYGIITAILSSNLDEILDNLIQTQSGFSLSTEAGEDIQFD